MDRTEVCEALSTRSVFISLRTLTHTVLLPCAVSCHLLLPYLRQRTAVEQGKILFHRVPYATPILIL